MYYLFKCTTHYLKNWKWEHTKRIYGGFKWCWALPVSVFSSDVLFMQPMYYGTMKHLRKLVTGGAQVKSVWGPSETLIAMEPLHSKPGGRFMNHSHSAIHSRWCNVAKIENAGYLWPGFGKGIAQLVNDCRQLAACSLISKANEMFKNRLRQTEQRCDMDILCTIELVKQRRKGYSKSDVQLVGGDFPPWRSWQGRCKV